jgi:hypothetical protein
MLLSAPLSEPSRQAVEAVATQSADAGAGDTAAASTSEMLAARASSDIATSLK